MKDGMAIAPDRPGHGIEFNWDALAAHRAIGAQVNSFK
jgi:L-alanine-DL-glutamate epimerase-like enolase superfamily enzyme